MRNYDIELSTYHSKEIINITCTKEIEIKEKNIIEAGDCVIQLPNFYEIENVIEHIGKPQIQYVSKNLFKILLPECPMTECLKENLKENLPYKILVVTKNENLKDQDFVYKDLRNNELYLCMETDENYFEEVDSIVMKKDKEKLFYEYDLNLYTKETTCDLSKMNLLEKFSNFDYSSMVRKNDLGEYDVLIENGELFYNCSEKNDSDKKKLNIDEIDYIFFSKDLKYGFKYTETLNSKDYEESSF